MVEWQISKDMASLILVADGVPAAEVSRWCTPEGATLYWGVGVRGGGIEIPLTLREACARACELLDLPPHAPPGWLLAQHDAAEKPAAAPPIEVPCPDCAGTGWLTFEDRHTETRQDRCPRCKNTGRIPAATGEGPEASAPPLASAPDTIQARERCSCHRDELSTEVQARRMAGRSQDGWIAWPLSSSHALRLALIIDGRPVAELEAFSVTGPWYANANSPDRKRHRLGAGGSLASAVQWCERITGYVVAPDA